MLTLSFCGGRVMYMSIPTLGYAGCCVGGLTIVNSCISIHKDYKVILEYLKYLTAIVYYLDLLDNKLLYIVI